LLNALKVRFGAPCKSPDRQKWKFPFVEFAGIGVPPEKVNIVTLGLNEVGLYIHPSVFAVDETAPQLK
jgi:hypothetical protein